MENTKNTQMSIHGESVRLFSFRGVIDSFNFIAFAVFEHCTEPFGFEEALHCDAVTLEEILEFFNRFDTRSLFRFHGKFDCAYLECFHICFVPPK